VCVCMLVSIIWHANPCRGDPVYATSRPKNVAL